MKNVLKPLAKIVLIPLRLTTAASETDGATHEKVFESGVITSTISTEEMNDIMGIVKSLKESGLLIKEVSETIKNEAKKPKDGFPSMLLVTLGASFLGNLSTCEGVMRTGEGTIITCQDS